MAFCDPLQRIGVENEPPPGGRCFGDNRVAFGAGEYIPDRDIGGIDRDGSPQVDLGIGRCKPGEGNCGGDDGQDEEVHRYSPLLS